MNNYIAVAMGGAIGAMARYAVGVALVRFPASAPWFPLGTLSVNVAGSLMIGLVWAFLQQQSESEFIRLFVAVGILGGFTTFSTFSLETIFMVSEGQWLRAGVNIMLNVLSCLIAAGMGLALGRWLF